MTSVMSFLPLLAVIFLVIGYGFVQKLREKTMVCTVCYSVGPVQRRAPGSIWIEVILWLCLLVPGLIYSIWRMTSKRDHCMACGASSVVPLASPAGRQIMARNQAGTDGVPSVQQITS